MCRSTSISRWLLLVVGALALVGCDERKWPDPPGPIGVPGGDAGAADAAGYDASGYDASGDAGQDAGPCPGGFELAGRYLDWDAPVTSPDGVAPAEVTQVGDPGNATTTAADGGLSLCLPGARAVVDLSHSEYLELRYTATPDSAVLPVVARGLQPARADDLFALELGLSRDTQTALVSVSVREYPAGDPVIGATVTLGNAHAGAFSADDAGVLGAGDMVIAAPVVLFANVEVGGGTTAVQVLAPANLDCQGPATIDLAADALAAADFVCTVP